MIDARTLVTNEANVTSTYFVLIGYSYRELGQLVLNMFKAYELNRNGSGSSEQVQFSQFALDPATIEFRRRTVSNFHGVEVID